MTHFVTEARIKTVVSSGWLVGSSVSVSSDVNSHLEQISD